MTNLTLIDKMNRASIIVWYIFETDKKMYVAFHVSLNSTFLKFRVTKVCHNVAFLLLL